MWKVERVRTEIFSKILHKVRIKEWTTSIITSRNISQKVKIFGIKTNFVQKYTISRKNLKNLYIFPISNERNKL